MPDTPKLAKAQLMELNAKFTEVINKDKSTTTVQFNPDSLKVSYANQIQQPPGGGDQNGPQANQFVGAGSTKLAVQLYFDVTSEIPPGALPRGKPDTNDVRVLTQRVAYFITPIGEPKNKPKKYIPPSVRFVWGTFQFDGIMESMEETLEIFSAEGRPLRATVAIAITQQQITEFAFNDKGVKDPPEVTKKSGAGKKPPGTTPLAEAPANTPLQSIADQTSGIGGDWQAIASFNGIENPRLLSPGQLIDLQPPSLSVGLGADIGVSADVGVSADIGVSAGVSIG